MYGLASYICISRFHSTEGKQTTDANSSARRASKFENECTSEGLEVPGFDVDVSINGIQKSNSLVEEVWADAVAV